MIKHGQNVQAGTLLVIGKGLTPIIGYMSFCLKMTDSEDSFPLDLISLKGELIFHKKTLKAPQK